MERSTVIATLASGMLVLVAGAGAVAAVGSLQDAGQESLAIGQAQPQVGNELPAVEDVAAVIPPTVAPLKTPKLKVRAQRESSASTTADSGSSTTTSNASSGSRPKVSGTNTSKSPSSSKATSEPKKHEDDSSKESSDHGSDHNDDHGQDDHAQEIEDHNDD